MKKFDYYFLGFFLVILSSVFLYTLSDYGITWDSALGELYIGDKNYYFAKTLELKHLDYSRDTVAIHHEATHPDFFRTSKYAQARPIQIWPLGPTLSALTKDIFYTKLRLLDPIDAHHISLLFLGLCLVTFQYIFARRNIGMYGAMVSILALILFPRFWAHLHNNIKDIPSAVFFSLVIFAFFGGIQKRNFPLLVLSALLWGLALSAKANALFLLGILGLWLMYVLGERYLDHEKLLTKPEYRGLLLFPVVGILTFFFAWPYLVLDFPSHLLDYVTYLQMRGLTGSSSWNYQPTKLVIYTIPLVILFFGALGLYSTLFTWHVSKKPKALLVLILLWCFMPVFRVSLPHTVDFDGMRHWLEFLPAFSLLAGVGAQYLFQEILEKVHKPLLIFMAVLLFVSPLYWNIRYHPYQLTYFNQIIGGLAGAQKANCCSPTDYWGSSYRKGIVWLNEHAEPNAILYVGVAEHIVDAVGSTWLRKDIQLKPIVNFSTTKRGQKGIRYLMYITRPGWYTPPVKDFEKNDEPIYVISVDGVPILKIFRIPAPQQSDQALKSVPQ